LQRKYNQAALLTKRLSALSGLPWLAQGLKRTRATAHQTGRNRATRLRQLQGAFTASPAVKGKHVVLVDDVFTTGSTATACTKALLKAGAKQVDVLVLAYVEP
jgi:ComF family protein